MLFPLPPIADAALQQFCAKHNLYEAIAAGYHYAQKFFLTDQIRIDFYPPYRDDEPEEAMIDFVIETDMTANEARDARRQFIEATNDVPGAFYLTIDIRFSDYEPS